MKSENVKMQTIENSSVVLYTIYF